MGAMGGRSGSFGHGFSPGQHGFRFGPVPFPFHEHNLRVAFPNARFGEARSEGFSGGAYGGNDVAAYDYDDDDDFTAEDLHFRVQEPFGPGDIGRHRPPEPYAPGPSEGVREGPWQGYDSGDW
jgi:hypothetical protein